MNLQISRVYNALKWSVYVASVQSSLCSESMAQNESGSIILYVDATLIMILYNE